MANKMKSTRLLAAAGLGAWAALAGSASADQQILDDLIVDGSLCAGQDCVNGESFGFDTLRLKENNLRLHFDDTSNSASFPKNDWRLVANDSGNGGAEYLAIEDSTAGRIPFRVEAGAPANTLYVASEGRIGVKTANPVVDIHVVQGNTPTLRLEQDGSSGFTPQVWDLAGNETNFFLRDATNGSKLSFRVEPDAPQNSLYIDSSGNIGLGKQNPTSPVHVVRTSGAADHFFVQELSSTVALRNLAKLSNNGDVSMTFHNTSTGAPTEEWKIANFGGGFFIGTPTSPGAEFLLSNTGDLSITGSFIAGGTALTVPDYVFEADYDLMPLSQVERFIAENGHLPRIPSADEINASGRLDMTQMMMSLLEKVEELTLYTLEQEKRIEALNRHIAAAD